MKKLILIFVVLMVAGQAQAGWNPFGSEKKKPPISIAQPKKPEPPKTCHYSVLMTGEAGQPKVFYIFQGPCGGIKQVGIIDERARLIIETNGNSIVSETKYFGNNKKTQLIKAYWGELTTIEFYEK